MPDQTYKFDAGKLIWDLIPWETLEGAVRVLMFGAHKYARNSFQNVRPYNERYFSALLRHLFAWRRGERLDSETGESHLAHAMCNLIFLIWGELNNVENENENAKMPLVPDRPVSRDTTKSRLRTNDSL